jgi:hypothetical protein
MKKMNINRQTLALFLITGLFCQGMTVFGQTVKVNVKVNSTVGIQQSQPFEVLPDQNIRSESKSITKPTRMVSAMGAFSFIGKENSNVLVQMNGPGVLTNKENQAMPFNLSIAWHNNTAADVNKLKFNDRKSNVFNFSNGGNTVGQIATQDNDQQAFLYLKGTAEVPANSQGTLIGEVHLTIEY